MGVLTLEGFRTAVQYGLDNRTDMPTVQLDNWINWSYLHVSQPTIYRHRELQTTQSIPLVAATDTYALNTDIHGIYDVYNLTQGYRLTPSEIRNFDESTPPSGQPRTYATWGNNIIFRGVPTAADTIRVRYWQQPAILTAGQATLLRQLWDEVIVQGAVWRGWRTWNRPDREEINRELFTGLINEAVNWMKVEGEDEGWVIEPQIPTYMERP